MKWSIITSTALFFAGCASTTAPSGWLPYPEETMYDSRGGWIDLRLNDGKGIGNSMISRINNDNGNIMVSGELIAIHEDTLFILKHEDHSKSSLIPILTQDIVAAKLGKFDYRGDVLKKQALSGIASTVTHGWCSLVTAPLWVVASIVAINDFSNLSIIKYPSKRYQTSLTDLREYARFPRGIPPSLNRQKIDIADKIDIQDYRQNK